MKNIVFCCDCKYHIKEGVIDERCVAPRITYFSSSDARSKDPEVENVDNNCAYFLQKE